MAITISEAIQRTVEHREIFADDVIIRWVRQPMHGHI